MIYIYFVWYNSNKFFSRVCQPYIKRGSFFALYQCLFSLTLCAILFYLRFMSTRVMSRKTDLSAQDWLSVREVIKVTETENFFMGIRTWNQVILVLCFITNWAISSPTCIQGWILNLKFIFLSPPPTFLIHIFPPIKFITMKGCARYSRKMFSLFDFCTF